MQKFSYRRRLNWSECDPVGIIFFPHYARWIADGLNEMFLSLGIDPVGISGDYRNGLPVVALSMKFHSAPQLHEEVTHVIHLEKLGNKSLSFRHEFRRADVLLMEAEDVRVWTTHVIGRPDSLDAISIPPAVRALFDDVGVSLGERIPDNKIV